MNKPKVNWYFDWLFVLFAGMWTLGAYVDGHAHIHYGFTIDSFFAPNHALFYLGIFLTTALLAAEAVKNYRRGHRFPQLLPREYMFALAGIALAWLAGVGDMFWHNAFGFEEGIEALLSPTHLLLAAGGAVAVGGPLHAIWYRETKPEKLHQLPTVLSLAYVFMLLTFMLQFLNPFNFPWAAMSFFTEYPIGGDIATGLGVANLIIYTGVLSGLVLSTVRSWTLPFGSFLLVLGLESAAVTFMHGEYKFLIAAALIAGLLLDILYRFLIAPKQISELNLRLFGFFAPAIIAAVYFAAIVIKDQLWWSIHMWTGAIAISGIAGLLLTYLVILPGDGTIKKKITQ